MLIVLVLVCVVSSTPFVEDADVLVLRELLANHSGWSHLVVRNSSFGGRGLFCPDDRILPANSTVMLIPTSLLFGPDTASRLYPDLPPRDFLGAEELTAAALARERFAKRRQRRTLLQVIRGFEEPDWSAWLAVLPKQAVRNAALWTKADAA
jgi:hypothetical protein